MTDSSEPPSPGGLTGSPYPPADARRRACARLVDLAVALLPLMVAPGGSRRAFVLASLALILCGDALFGPGRSLGKRLFGLRTVLLPSRKAAGPAASLERNAIFAAALLPALFVSSTFATLLSFSALGCALALEGAVAVLPLTTDLGQRRLGDLLARTQVIDASIALGLPLPGTPRVAPRPGLVAPPASRRRTPPNRPLHIPARSPQLTRRNAACA